MSCYQDLTQELRQAGLRMTPQRLMVMDAVFHHEGHITAEDVHAKVQAYYPYVDLSTIYRTLQVLKAQGLVAELRVPDGPTQYEATLDDSHHHAICHRCGTMLDLEPEVLEPLRDQLLTQYQFRAELTHMAVFGVCRTCTEQEQGVAT
ncbi:MAG: Fur family transcriptional regulator [Anaerolineae bacterium]